MQAIEETYQFDTRVRIGSNIVSNYLSAFVKGHGTFGYVAVGTGRAVSDALVGEIEAIIGAAGCTALTIHNLRSSLTIEQLAATLAGAHPRRPDWIVAIGGGGTIDAAKLIGLWGDDGCLVAISKTLGELQTRATFASVVPLLAIPTCVGSGAEVSNLADVLLGADRVKEPVIKQDMFPRVALVDETLARAPAAMQAAALVDACAHLIDPLISAASNPPPQLDLMITAIRRLVTVGERMVAGERDFRSFTEFTVLTHLAVRTGLIRSSAAQSAVHRIEHGLSARLGCLHGEGLALLLPPFLEKLEETRDPAMVWMADAFSAAFRYDAMPSAALRAWLGSLPLELPQKRLTQHEAQQVASDVMERYQVGPGLLGNAMYDHAWVSDVVARATVGPSSPAAPAHSSELHAPDAERVFGGSLGRGPWRLLMTPLETAFEEIVSQFEVEPRKGWFRSAVLSRQACRHEVVILCPPPGGRMAIDALRLAQAARGQPVSVDFIGLAGALVPGLQLGAILNPDRIDIGVRSGSVPARIARPGFDRNSTERPEAGTTLRSIDCLSDGTTARLRSWQWAGVDLVDLEASHVAEVCSLWGVGLTLRIVISDHPLGGQPIWSRPMLSKDGAVSAGLSRAILDVVYQLANGPVARGGVLDG